MAQIGVMIAIDDIEDEKSLKQWLTEWPAENWLGEDAARALAVTIAHRAAMRVLPWWWDWTLGDRAQERELTAMPVLLCNLITGVAAVVPTPEIKGAASEASYAADMAYGSAARATGFDAGAPADVAARSADATAGAAEAAFDATDAAQATAARAAALAAVAVRTAWNEIRTDCKTLSLGQDCLPAPLWSAGENPFDKEWRHIKSTATDPQWSFWIKWYDDALAGRAPNWPMLEQIALIKPEVWEAGPKAVADEIAEIQRRWSASDQADIGTELSALPAPPPETVTTVRTAMNRNLRELPPTYEAIEALILLEIERLTQKNYCDDDEQKEAQRQIAVFLKLHSAIVRMRGLIPETRKVDEAAAEETLQLWRLYMNKIAELPRAKVDEVVEGMWETGKNVTQFGLITGSAYLATMIGVTPLAGLSIAAMCFAPKKAGEIIKAAKESMWPKSP